MRVTVITVVYNDVKSIEDTVLSVINQNYFNIEYIIIDGGSTDGTLEKIKKYKNRISIISEKDNGIYDAMNKGIREAKGDIIGFLNSGDIFYDNSVVSDITELFTSRRCDAVYGDLVYINEDGRVVRVWKAGEFNKKKLRRGWMPPHPTFYVKKELIEKYGEFKSGFKISGDYELMLRLLLRYNINVSYTGRIMVKMKVGGVSNKGIKNTLRKMYEDYLAWKVNELGYPPFLFAFKPFSKIHQFLIRGGR